MKKLLLTTVMLLSAGQIFSAKTPIRSALNPFLTPAEQKEWRAKQQAGQESISFLNQRIGDVDPGRHSRTYEKITEKPIEQKSPLN